ncbi:MAG: glutaredoxin [Labilithrix sp.]|nr:glutaredoxin [Labilithrix sp.]
MLSKFRTARAFAEDAEKPANSARGGRPGRPNLAHPSGREVSTIAAMSARPLLDSSRLAPTAASEIAAFHADVIAEVAKTTETHPVVVVGMAQNPFVKKTRKALTDAGITFEYLEYGSYLSGWKPRLAIKLWSGYPTFPQVFVKGVLIGGHAQTTQGIADGSIKKQAAGGA